MDRKLSRSNNEKSIKNYYGIILNSIIIIIVKTHLFEEHFVLAKSRMNMEVSYGQSKKPNRS